MYPKLSDLLADLLNVNIPLPIQTFGFFVAIAFVLANYFFTSEMQRKERQGFLEASKKIISNHLKHTFSNYLYASITGFLLGYKGLYLFLNYSEFAQNPQSYLLNVDGNWLGGIFGVGVAIFFKYREINNSHRLPETEEITIHPHQLVGNMTLIAAVAGLIGAKIFHNLENLSEFIKDPIGNLISFSGLTMYGGLITGSVAVIWYARKNNLNIRHVVDACAPGLMLAYGIGRLGCHLSGDGDWGVPNSAYKYVTVTKAIHAPIQEFYNTAGDNLFYYQKAFSDIKEINTPEDIPNIYFKGPDFLPTWMISYNYPHNVINDGVPIEDCQGNYCNVLPVGVLPTSFYEFIMGTTIFGILFWLRKRIKTPGVLFSIYLMFNGFERFWIEKIRVNTQYQSLRGLTQAEIIAIALFLLGLLSWIYFTKIKPSAK